MLYRTHFSLFYGLLLPARMDEYLKVSVLSAILDFGREPAPFLYSPTLYFSRTVI